MRDKKSQLLTELYEVITHSFLINISRKFQFFYNILSLYNCLLKICFFFLISTPRSNDNSDEVSLG